MEEFLILQAGSRKYQRAKAMNEHGLHQFLEVQHAHAIAFSSDGTAFLLYAGDPPAPVVARLPWLVRLAWWGVRFSQIRLGFQLLCWAFVAVLVLLSQARMSVSPVLMVLAGGLNLLAWWWFELDRGRIEPGVLGVSSGSERDRASRLGRQTKGV